MPPTYDELAAQYKALQAEIVGLRAENKWLKSELFGPGKSEKMDRLQANLPLAETPAVPHAPEVKQVSYERVASPRPKREHPAEAFKEVPVKETVVIEPREVKANPQDSERIGEERTFEIDIVAPQVFKREIIRPKYRHRTDRSVAPIVAPAPERPVMGGYALSARAAVRAVGSDDPPADDGRLGADRLGMAGAHLQADAPALDRRQLPSSR